MRLLGIRHIVRTSILIPCLGWSVSAFADIALSSSAISGGSIGKVHACTKMGGGNKSIPINVSNLPSGTSHIAIIMDDPDARPVAGKVWVHWNVFNVKVSGQSYAIDSGKKPTGVIGKNSGGSGYGGMCPPNGRHKYRIAVFALKNEVKVKASGLSGKAYTIENFEKDFKSEILGKSMITGNFG